MDIESVLKETLEDLLIRLESPFENVIIDKEKQNDSDLYRINIETEDPSMLIGFHGETIHALQHLLKVLAWEKTKTEYNILVDVDNYRQRQEENVLTMTKRKVDMVRKTRKTQILPPMSPYFRRLVHLFLNTDEFKDITTESIGESDHRQVTIIYKG
jgi:spoIIIJ-associated protein